MNNSVTVIIPIYNAEKYLERAIKSALNQEYVSEIILIDDASTDNSKRICESFVKEHINISAVFLDKNLGAGQTRNIGLKKATSELIAFLDADDYYLENRFEKDVEILQNKKIDGTYNLVRNIFTNNETVGSIKKDIVIQNGAEDRNLFFQLVGLKEWHGHIHLNGLTIRKSSLLNAGLCFNDNLRLHQDTDFIIKLTWKCAIVPSQISSPVSMREIHKNNRITQRYTDIKLKKKNDLLLYSSLYNWSKNNIEQKEINSHFKNLYLTRKIVQLPIILRQFYAIFILSFENQLFYENKYYIYIRDSVFGRSFIRSLVEKLRNSLSKK